jgi:predicted component of type VI protein secretion system
MKLSLVVLTTGKMEGKTLEIKVPQFVIGRDADCQLRPASSLISKRHCAILQREERAFIQDFASTNGTHVNDVPVEGEIEIKDGDVLRIGPIQFAVRLEAAVAPPAAAKPAAPAKAAPTAPPPVKAASGNAKTPAGLAVKTQPTPAAQKPAAAAAHAGSSGTADDDIAAMLLSLSDDTSSGALSSGDGVPEGSTVHDLRVPNDLLEGKEGADKKEDKDQLAKVKAAQANTSSAAKSILDKYLKRPRT